MKILFVLTYYHPHISGLTIYVKRLAETLAKEGHSCTVLTAQFDATLAPEEVINGVRIVRIPIWKKVSKGVIMTSFLQYFVREARQHDIVSAHLPQFEAGLLAFVNRLFLGKKTVFTYHCDLLLPPGVFNRIVDFVVHFSNRIGGIFANAIVAYTDDYAKNSPFLSSFLSKVTVIPPPVIMPMPTATAVEDFKKQYGISGKKLIGVAARLAYEKGFDVLLNAIPFLEKELDDFQIIIVGQYKDVLGEDVYKNLQPLFERHAKRVKLLGVIPETDLPAFYASLDVLTLPSINSTESFGLVQVEAMLVGTPSVPSNLPGVRVPVQKTGMGVVVPIKDSQGLAAGLLKVINNPMDYIKPRHFIEECFSLRTTVAGYLKLFTSL